jgi:hypothetical protein
MFRTYTILINTNISEALEIMYEYVVHSGRAVHGVGFGRLVTGIVRSNPARGMYVCLCVSVLCCSV